MINIMKKDQGKSGNKGAVVKGVLSLLITISLILNGLSVFSFADTVNNGDFSVTQQVDSANEYWFEYTYTVKNNTSQGVTSVTLLIPTSGDMQKCETYGNQSLTYDASSGGILLYAPVNIASGGSVTLDKMGINPKTNPITIGEARAYAVNESRNWSSSHEYGASSGSGTGDGTPSSSLSLEYELKGELKESEFEDTPAGKHGKLHLAAVEQYGNAPVIVDEHGAAVQLRGASTHGMQWDICTPFINEDAFHTFRDEWGVNLIRLVCYPRDYNGYLNGGKDVLDDLIEKGMDYARNLGMYAIVDWHVHQYNPNEDIEAAKTFFAKYSAKYADYDNVLYEICNEPTNTPWYSENGNDIYSYANEIIPIIRENDDDAIIIVGTNTWSQDVDDVHNKPITGYDNIMYTFHFYSGSHGSSYRERVKNAIDDGTPVFITEFGICDSSGNGNVQTAEADLWMDFCDKYNISHACWSISNKDEDASYFKTGCTKTGKWTGSDLRDTGIWLVNTYRAKEARENEGGSGSGSSSSSGSSSPDRSFPDSSSSDSSSSDRSSSDSSSSDSSSSDRSKSGNDEGSSSVLHRPGDSSGGSSDSSRSSSDRNSSGSSSDSSKSTSGSESSSGSSSDSSKSASGSESSSSSGKTSPDTGMIKTKEYSTGDDTQKVMVSYNAVLTYTGKNPVTEDFFKAVKTSVSVDPQWSKYVTVKKVKYKNAKNAYISGDGAYSLITKKPSAVIVMALNDTGRALKKSDMEAGKELSAYLKRLNQAMKSDPIFFEINPADLSEMEVSAKSYSVERSKLSGVKASAPGFGIKGIKQGKDFDIFIDSFNESDGSITIIGKGNYTGLKKVRI